jgi:hypothetical protein
MKRTAAILLALLTVAGPAQALIVTKDVGPLLNEAKALMTSGKYDAAMTKLNEAEAVKVTADDETAINSMKEYIQIKVSHASPSPQP